MIAGIIGSVLLASFGICLICQRRKRTNSGLVLSQVNAATIYRLCPLSFHLYVFISESERIADIGALPCTAPSSYKKMAIRGRRLYFMLLIPLMRTHLHQLFLTRLASEICREILLNYTILNFFPLFINVAESISNTSSVAHKSACSDRCT